MYICCEKNPFRGNERENCLIFLVLSFRKMKYKDNNFSLNKQGKQLRLFANSEYTIISKNVKEAEFIDAFKHLAPIVIETIYSAHEDVLKQWRNHPPRSNGTKATDLNDRVQTFISESVPEHVIDSYKTVCIRAGSFLCVFKLLDNKNLPKISNNSFRAFEKFSQYKGKNNDTDVPYITIGYQCSKDYQQIIEINAVKTYIDAEKGKLCVDWFVPLDEMLNKKNIDSNQNIFEEIHGELPPLKKKSS